MLCLAGCMLTLRGTASSELEYRVKAAILLNISKFVRWAPEVQSGPGEPASVCVLGEDPFGTALEETMRGKKVEGRPVVIRRYRDPEDIRACQILFISSSETRRVERILRSLPERGTLTVSEIPSFTARGGIINFVLDKGRVRFEVGLAAASRAGLQISSQLLHLAKVVDSVPEKGK